MIFQEFGHPYLLLKNKGYLYKMVQQSESAMAEILINSAKNVRYFEDKFNYMHIFLFYFTFIARLFFLKLLEVVNIL